MPAHLAGQQFLALDERAAGLHEVVDDDDVTAPRLALLQPHDALVPVPHLGADHLPQRRMNTLLHRHNLATTLHIWQHTGEFAV